jgi:fructose-1,6-bisphosphatase
MRIPDKGKIYSINEGYSYLWDPAVADYVASKKNPKVLKSFISCKKFKEI